MAVYNKTEVRVESNCMSKAASYNGSRIEAIEKQLAVEKGN